MHCGICGSTVVEVRPCYISRNDDEWSPIHGDIYLCQKCAEGLALQCTDSVFVTWVGFPCDECSQTAAFDGDIDDYPIGLVCDDCLPVLGQAESERGVWVCEPCWDARHHGHHQRQLQPILDRLSRL